MLKYVVALAVLMCLLGALYFYGSAAFTPIPVGAADPKNATYEIQEKMVTLTNGSSIVEDTPSSKTITAYFGNEAIGDLDGDGDEDSAFILIQNGGGSGTFVYGIVALKTDTGYIGTNGILLGDRVAPQTTEIKDGIAIFNYADRKPNEPMVVQPSVGVTVRTKIENGTLTVIE